MAKAVEAISAAFSAGLKRSAADPLGLIELMRRLASGDYARAYEDPLLAAGAGRREGEEVLAFLFGSPEIWRRLAAQAAAFSGLAPDKLQELRPPMAAITLGGMAEKSAAANPIFAAWLKELCARAPERPAKGPLDRLEEQEARREAESSADRFARLQGEMMRVGLATVQAGTAAWQEALRRAAEERRADSGPGEARPETPLPGGELFGEMLEAGVWISEDYLRAIEALLEKSPEGATHMPTRRRDVPGF